METPTTLRGEIRKVLAESKDPLTRVEIFAKCKFCADEKTLSTVLSQLLTAGDIKKSGELERIGARTLALYAIAGGGIARAKKPRAGALPPLVKTKRGPYKKRAKPAGRSLVLRKVQRRNADSPAPAPPDFRCGIFSDGSLDLEREGKSFRMGKAEVSVLIAYLGTVDPRAPR